MIYYIIPAIFIVLVIVIFLLKQLKLDQKIQFCILAALIGTLIISFFQLKELIDDNNLRQRPFVGLSEINSEFLGEKKKQSDLDSQDEIAVLLKFENKGLSTAKVQYIKLKMFYGFFSIKNGENKKGKPTFLLTDLINPTEGKLYKIGNQEVPVKSIIINEDIILLPRQSTVFTILIHALELKKNIYKYDGIRPAPIFVETEIRHSDLSGTPYYYNSVNHLYWIPAFYNKIVTKILKSNNQDKPLHLTLKSLYSIVANYQNVKISQ